MMGNGSSGKWMVRALFNGTMGRNMLVSIKMAKERDKEYTIIKTIVDIRGSGRGDCNMVEGLF